MRVKSVKNTHFGGDTAVRWGQVMRCGVEDLKEGYKAIGVQR